jgi:hypothetical protein
VGAEDKLASPSKGLRADAIASGRGRAPAGSVSGAGGADQEPVPLSPEAPGLDGEAAPGAVAEGPADGAPPGEVELAVDVDPVGLL